MLSTYVRRTNFIQNVSVLDLNCQGKKFESSALGSSCVIISQTVTDRTNIAIVDLESRMWPFHWYDYILPWVILNVSVTITNISTNNISLTFHWYIYVWPCPIMRSRLRWSTFGLWKFLKLWQVGSILLLPSNAESNMGFRLTYLNLSLVISKGQLGSWNGLSPNSSTFLL